MKNKSLSPLAVALILLISAGAVVILLLFAGIRSFFMIASVSGSPAEPVVGLNALDDQPAGEGYETIVEPAAVDRVEVEFGIGSPRPVQVVVSGRLPDACSQIEFASLVQVRSAFEIVLSAVRSQPDACSQEEIPFTMRIPLNVIYLPGGEYSVTVNDIRTDFSYANGSTTGLLWTENQPIRREEIEIVQLEVEHAAGSPAPLHLLISGDLPSVCTQLGEIWMRQEGPTFFIRLVAYIPEGAECAQNSLPFWLEIPLNVTPLAQGRYEVDANGTVTNFKLPLP